MKKIYLDHHFLVNENLWPVLQELIRNKNAQLVISIWNLIEIAQAHDSDQKMRRLDFIKSVNPIYVHDMQTLQKYEIRSFLWLNFFYAGLYPYNAFTPSFPTYIDSNFGKKVRSSYTIADFFQDLRPGDLNPILQQQNQHILALQALQTTEKKKLIEVEEDTFYRYLFTRLPDFAPDGSNLDPNYKNKIISFCHDQRAKLHRNCPAIFSESELGLSRKSNPTRRPLRSDSADLMHCVVALSYCDVFISNDRFAQHCCVKAKERLTREKMKTAELLNSVHDFKDSIINS
jgi:hypothetical protein